MQVGRWEHGKPEYIPPARNYMLLALLFSYASAAVMYLAAVPGVKLDIAKLARSGGSSQVCILRASFQQLSSAIMK